MNEQPCIHWKCRFGWHDWSQWEDAGRYEQSFLPINIQSELRGSIRERDGQKRACRSCGIAQFRLV